MVRGMVRDMVGHGRVIFCSMAMVDALMACLVSSSYGNNGTECDKSLFIFK